MNKISHNRNVFTHARHKVIKAGAKKLHNTKFYVALVALVVLIGTPCLFPAIYSSMNGVVIRSSGQIHAREVWANSGSAEDIQAAVYAVAAAGGGTVYVPEGIFSYPPEVFTRAMVDGGKCAVSIPGGVSVIGAGAGTTVLLQTADATVTFFQIDGQNAMSARISGFTFSGYVTSEAYDNRGIAVWRTKDFRIDHCVFLNFVNFAISVKDMSGYVTRGVIDHNTIDNPYKDTLSPVGYWDWAYGIGVLGDGSTWLPLDQILGKYEDNVVYIEDNAFARCRYALASNTGGYYVFRHNNVIASTAYGSFGKAGVDIHEGEPTYIGGRGLEAYDNTFTEQTPEDYGHEGFKMRCGGGVIFNNTINDLSVGVWLLKADWATDEQHSVKDLYIWDNTYNNVGTLLSKSDFYQENEHYFLYAKPNYTLYQYPHPLTLEGTP